MVIMKIDRTLFWFKDGEIEFLDLNERFFSLGTLLNRLLNEKYDGKKIEFINIDFSTERTYELFPKIPKNDAYYYGGHLRYYGIFDINEFRQLSYQEQDIMIWNKACSYLSRSAKSIKNKKLLGACEYACNKGLELELNADYRMVEKDIVLFNQPLKAAVWVNFKKDGMYSKFTLEKGSTIVFEKEIDKAKNGVEFFLEMYKDIDLEDNDIVIKGRKDVEYLPLKIPIIKEELPPRWR